MDLLHAAESGHFSIVKDLLSKEKSQIHSYRHNHHHYHVFNVGASAIHYASRSGHLNIVKYFLEFDVTILNDCDRENWTALHYTCYNGHIHIVRLLLEYNPDVNIKDKYFSQTPVQFAMYRQFHDIVKLFDSNCNSIDEREETRNIPVF